MWLKAPVSSLGTEGFPDFLYTVNNTNVMSRFCSVDVQAKIFASVLYTVSVIDHITHLHQHLYES